MYKNNINLNESAYYIGASMSGCSRQWNCKHLDPVDSMQLVLNPKFALLKTEIRMLVFILKENFEKVVKNLLPFQKQLYFSYNFILVINFLPFHFETNFNIHISATGNSRVIILIIYTLYCCNPRYGHASLRTSIQHQVLESSIIYTGKTY